MGCVSGVTLDWSSAEVRDGQLEVGLRGELPKEWKHKFERTVALIPGGDWGKVSLKKDRVRVHEVAAGSEDRLRHFLESVVQEANATLEPSDGEAREKPDQVEDEDEDEDDGPDAQMTEQFRSFATKPDH
jgi:hypothetical protein